MELLREAISHVSLADIWQLDWIIKGPGLAIISLFMIRAVVSLFTLRLIRCAVSLTYAFVFAVILSRAGFAIQALMVATPPSVT